MASEPLAGSTVCDLSLIDLYSSASDHSHKSEITSTRISNNISADYASAHLQEVEVVPKARQRSSTGTNG